MARGFRCDARWHLTAPGHSPHVVAEEKQVEDSSEAKKEKEKKAAPQTFSYAHSKLVRLPPLRFRKTFKSRVKWNWQQTNCDSKQIWQRRKLRAFKEGRGEKKRSDFLHSSCWFAEKPWRRLNAAGCRLMAALNNSPRRDERQVKTKKELVHLTAECGGASSGNLAFLSFLFSF